jgi:DNA repair/transcription protein MET18/MMS19
MANLFLLDRDFQTPLLMYKQQILQIFVLSLIESDPSDIILRQASLRGIHEMVLMKQFLKQEEINIAAGHLTRQLMREDKQSRQLALSTLGVITKLYPLALGQHTFPVLLEELACLEKPDVSSSYRVALDAIEVLGVHPSVFKIIKDPLLQRLDYACGTLGKREIIKNLKRTLLLTFLSTGQQNITYLHDIASTILNIYKAVSKDSEILAIGQKILLPNLLLKCIPSSIGVPNSWYLDDTLIETFAMIAAITTRLSMPR